MHTPPVGLCFHIPWVGEPTRSAAVMLGGVPGGAGPFGGHEYVKKSQDVKDSREKTRAVMARATWRI